MEPLVAELPSADTIWLPDCPGLGRSDALAGEPDIETAANALVEALGSHVEGSVNLLGFHTGCLVAAEWAIAHPSKVANLVMVDIPYFEADRRAALVATTEGSVWPPDNADLVAELYEKDVASRVAVSGQARAFDFFRAHLSAQTDPQQWFRAAFEYRIERRFKQIMSATRVIATDSTLRSGTIAAGELIRDAQIIDAPHIKNPVFESHASTLAELL